MTETDFWRLIEAAALGADSWACKKRALLAQIATFDRVELVSFTALFDRMRKAAFTPEMLCGAALLYRGFFSYDSFLDFTDCLVVTSKEIYTKLIADPDQLVEHPELADCPEMHFSQLALDVFDARGGNALALLHEAVGSAEAPKITYGERRGMDILAPEIAAHLTPRLFTLYGKETFAE
jgi:hypothetical protein